MRSSPVLSFLVLAYAISWSIFAVAQWGIGITDPLAWTLASALFMFGPGLAALLLFKPLGLTWPDLGVIFKGIRWKWMGIAVLIALAMPVLALFFNWILGDLLHFQSFGHTSISKEMVINVLRDQLSKSGVAQDAVNDRAASIQALPVNGPLLLLMMLGSSAIAGCTVNFLFAMGEELGWRGLLFHSTHRFGLLKQVLFTGVVWGLWHAPLIHHGLNYPGHPWGGIAFMCLFTTGLALPLAWVRFRTHCVWSAGMLHGTVNAAAGITVLFTHGAVNMLGGGAGLTAILGMVVVGALLFLFDPRFRNEFRAA